MNNNLAKRDNHSFSLEDVRSLIQSQGGAQATPAELTAFVNLCRTYGANPIAGDFHFVKYSDGSPAAMYPSKGHYTKIARRHGARWDAGVVVRRGDQIVEESGSFMLSTDTLLGGWARVITADGLEFYDKVLLENYNTGKSTWKKLPQTMIRKVALVHVLREAYPEDFEGFYDSSEMGQATPNLDIDQIIEERSVLNIHTPTPIIPAPQEPPSSQPIYEVFKNEEDAVEAQPVAQPVAQPIAPINVSSAPVAQPVAQPVATHNEIPHSFPCPIHSGENLEMRDGKHGIFWSHRDAITLGYCNVGITYPPKPEFQEAWLEKIEQAIGTDTAERIRSEGKPQKLGWWLQKVSELLTIEPCVECDLRGENQIGGVWFCLEHTDAAEASLA